MLRSLTVTGGSGKFRKCFSLMKLCDFIAESRRSLKPSPKWNLNFERPRKELPTGPNFGGKKSRVGNWKVGALKRQQINLIKFAVNILYLLWKLASLVPCDFSQILNYSLRLKAEVQQFISPICRVLSRKRIKGLVGN